MLPRLVVLAGAEPGKGLPLSDQTQYFVIEETADGAHRRALLLPLANEQARRAEVRLEGDLVQVRNLQPFQTFSINGEQALRQGEAATLRRGDVLTVHDVVMRVVTGSTDDDDFSGLHVTVPDNKLEATIDKTRSATEASDIAEVVGRGVSPEKVKTRLSCLQAIFRAALTATDSKTLLKLTLDAIGEQHPGVQGSVMWRLGKTESFRRLARLGGKSKEVQMSRTVIKHVIKARSAVLSHDTTIDERLKKSQSLRTKGTRSVLCVPILQQGEVSGVIHLTHPGFNHFDESDLALVVAAAETAAMALANLETRQHQQTSASLLATKNGMEIAADAARVATGEAGVKDADVSICTGYVDETQRGSGGAFAEVMPVPPPPGSLMANASPVVIGCGELVGQATAVDAVRAHAVVRTLGPYGFAPGALVCEIARVLTAAGIAPEGTSVVARYDPGSGELHLAAAGDPIVIHYHLMDGKATPVQVWARAPSLGALTPELTGRPTPIKLGPGDTTVIVAGGLADTGPRTLEVVSAWVVARVGNGPPAIMKELTEQLGSMITPGRSASIVALRRG